MYDGISLVNFLEKCKLLDIRELTRVLEERYNLLGMPVLTMACFNGVVIISNMTSVKC